MEVNYHYYFLNWLVGKSNKTVIIGVLKGEKMIVGVTKHLVNYIKMKLKSNTKISNSPNVLWFLEKYVSMATTLLDNTIDMRVYIYIHYQLHMLHNNYMWLKFSFSLSLLLVLLSNITQARKILFWMIRLYFTEVNILLIFWTKAQLWYCHGCLQEYRWRRWIKFQNTKFGLTLY